MELKLKINCNFGKKKILKYPFTQLWLNLWLTCLLECQSNSSQCSITWQGDTTWDSRHLSKINRPFASRHYLYIPLEMESKQASNLWCCLGLQWKHIAPLLHQWHNVSSIGFIFLKHMLWKSRACKKENAPGKCLSQNVRLTSTHNMEMTRTTLTIQTKTILQYMVWIW